MDEKMPHDHTPPTRDLQPREFLYLDFVPGRGTIIGVYDPEQTWCVGDRLRHMDKLYEVTEVERPQHNTHPPTWADNAGLVVKMVLTGEFGVVNPVNENPPEHRRHRTICGEDE